MRKKVKVTKKLAAAGLAAILACQVMGCGTGEKPTKDVSDEKVSEVKSQDTSKKEVLKVAVSLPGRAAEFVAQERRAHIALIIERRDARADERKALPSAVLRKRQAGPAVCAEAVAARLEKIMAERAPRRIEQVEQKYDRLHTAPHSPQSRARRPL